MDNKYEKVEESRLYLKNRLEGRFKPEVILVQGTGIDGFEQDMDIVHRVQYEDIPHFPISTVESHVSELVFGWLFGKAVALMKGRFHYYEGYSAAEITFPIYVLKALGAKIYIATNVAGGLNPHYQAGDLVMVTDHINLHPDHPLRGPNDVRLGLRFPDMLQAYDKQLMQKAADIAEASGISINKGVYVGLQGPSLETPAEYRFLRIIGGDLVGMSTVPEVIVANHAGLGVLVISIVSNVCYPTERLSPTTVQEVIAVASKAAPDLTHLIGEVIKKV